MKRYKEVLIAILVCCVCIVGCEEGMEMVGTVVEPPAEEQPPTAVNLIPDPNLAAAVRETLGLPADALLTAEVLQDLKELKANDREIVDLTGLEYAVNLTELDLLNLPNSETPNGVSDVSALANLTQLTDLNLWRNQVSDVSPLANLTQLTRLWLGDNQLSDISVLANLTQLTRLALSENDLSDISVLANFIQLTYLFLGDNQLSDISVLANLTQLTNLGLDNNQLSDISVLANFTQLRHLWLWNNQVSDVSVLANLTQLTDLRMWDNQVSDISPLVAGTGLDAGAEVYLQNNPLNAASINTHIPALQARGVTVEY